MSENRKSYFARKFTKETAFTSLFGNGWFLAFSPIIVFLSSILGFSFFEQLLLYIAFAGLVFVDIKLITDVYKQKWVQHPVLWALFIALFFPAIVSWLYKKQKNFSYSAEVSSALRTQWLISLVIMSIYIILYIASTIMISL